MNFSILIPTRNRISELLRLLESINSKTKNIDQVEIICCCDINDKLSIDFLIDLNKFSNFDLKILIKEQSDNLSEDYYNYMAKTSIGKILWVLNDDCEIMTQDWDEIVLNQVKNFRYKIFYLDIGDSTRNFNNNGEYSCFPMVSREAFEALGYFFIPVIKGWSADKYLFDLYDGVGRIIPFKDKVFVEHHREAKDQNFKKMERLFEEDRKDRQNLNMPLKIKQFNEFIEQKDKVYKNLKEMYNDYWKYYFPIHSSFMNHTPVTWLINSPLKFDTVLEIGTGNGESIEKLIKSGKDARGIEFSNYLFENCLKHKFPKGEVEEGDVRKIKFPDNCFDVVCAFDVLEHLQEKDVLKAIREIYRVTNKYFFGTISHRIDHYKKFHLTVKQPQWWINQFLSVGFKIKEINPKPHYPIFVFEK